MSEEVQIPAEGAWREWAYRHRRLLSAVAHLLLFGLAWLAAFLLANNFKGSPSLYLPASWSPYQPNPVDYDPKRIVETGDADNLLSGYINITGLNESNTDRNGKLYLAVVDDGGGEYHVDIYRDRDGVRRVGYTEPYREPGLQPVKPVEKTDSAGTISGHFGLGGTITVDRLGAGTGLVVDYAFQDWLTLFLVPLLVPVLTIKLTVFVLMGIHRASWRYVSLRDVFSITKAAWWSFLGIFIVYYVLQNLSWFGLQIEVFGERFPDSVFLVDFAGTIGLVCGARLAVRLYYEEKRPPGDGVTPKLLVLGAGNAGENVAREILRMPESRYRVVGFLDDDRSKHGAQIHGIEVLGPIADVKEICKENDVDEILIAIPSAARRRLREVVELCQGTNLRFKTLPALMDLIEGRASVKEIRDVDINDLLGRAPVKLDEEQIGNFLRGRVVMVTGAGGSIGAEMCRQIALFKPRRLVLVERAEPSLFPIDRELRASFPDMDVIPQLADIGDERRMAAIIEQEKPSAVFHAAAHKHVPMMEYNPGEAIKNNIRGTRTVADVATGFGCEKFVMISTDKAVNPTSVMGCSKRVAEMYIQALDARSPTQFVTVRFGNVLGSSGSVIPIFREQIARGGPVTVTHPEMMRYFMTIPEAAQLVLQAASMGAGGEIFVLDMGEQVKIVDMARQMITLSGFRPEVDIKIEYCGIRPGEKLYEELAIDGEDVSRTAHPKVGIWQNIPTDWDTLVQSIGALVADADGLAREEARRRLKQIVPEFQLEPPAADQPKSKTSPPLASADTKIAPV